MARPAVLSPQIFDRVNEMVENGAAKNKSEAFKMISEDPLAFGIHMTGKSSGTVAANYFREQRKQEEAAKELKKEKRVEVKPEQPEPTEEHGPRVDWKLEQEKVQSVEPTVDTRASQASVNKLALSLIDSAHEIAELLQQRENENEELRQRLNRVTSALS